MRRYSHNPPTKTRSYKSRELMDARKYFNLKKIMLELDPSKRDFDIMFQAAVSITAYGTTRGAKSPFPSPMDFVDIYYGYGSEEEPVWQDIDERKRSTLMLRGITRISEYLRKHRKDLGLGVFDIYCPICDNDKITVMIGFGIMWDKKRESIFVDYDKIRMLALNIECQCTCFNTFDFSLIEELAKEEVRAIL